MAVVIGAFAHQNITINTEMALDITVTGDPDTVYIEGELEGFWTNWNNPTLEVRGQATRLVNNRQFSVVAKRGSDAPVKRQGSFSVLPAVPVISTVPRRTLYRGLKNEIIVPISNKPSSVRATSRWTGMKYEPHPKGLRIFGDVPSESDAELTFDEHVITVYAASGNLMDTLDIQVVFGSGLLFCVDSRDDKVYVFSASTGDGQRAAAIRTFSLPAGNNRAVGVTADGTNLYCLHNPNIGGRANTVYVFSALTGDGQRATAIRTFDLPPRRFTILSTGITTDGTNLYCVEHALDQVIVFSALTGNGQTATAIRMFNLPSGNNDPTGITTDGLHLYCVDSRDDKVYVFSASTGNGERATAIRTFSLPSGNNDPTGITMDGLNLYCVDSRDDKVYVFSPLTGNGERATAIRTFSLPSGNNDPTGITIG